MRAPFLLTFLMCALLSPEMVSATPQQSAAHDVIERLRSVYQVDRLNEASTIGLTEDRRMEFPDHEYASDFHQLSEQRYHHILDFQNQAASTEVLTRIANSHWHGRSILKDGKSQFIIYANGFVQDQGEQEFPVEYGRVIRGVAALMARDMVNSPDKLRHSGEEMWLGKMHDVLLFDMPHSPTLTVYVEKETGHITHMDRTVGSGTKVSYTYRGYGKQDGIAVATEHSVYANGARIYYGFARGLKLDPATSFDAFELDSGLLPEPQLVDQSTMTVERVGVNAFHVGQEGSYSTFFPSDSGIVAYGLGAGFGERLSAFREVTGNSLALTHAIVADLHGVDRIGAPDAALEGAVILVTSDAEDRVRSMLEENGIAGSIQSVEGQLQLGEVLIADVATAQAAHNLIAYSAAGRVLTQTGHFHNPYVDRPGYADFTAVTLRDALLPLAISPAYVLSNESRKAESWQNFLAAVEGHNPSECFRDRPICEDW